MMDRASRRKEAINPEGRTTEEWIAVPEERVAELGRALQKAIGGEARFRLGDRALYATDASNYRQIPYGVVLPRSAEDVVATVRLCNRFDVPVTPRGGGTSLAGQTCNSAVIIDFSKYMHRLLALDPERRIAVVEPGCILDHLRGEAEKHHLTFGPDPATHNHNTLGGMIGNDSCGVHSIMAGRTADNVESLDIVTYDGLEMTVGPTSPQAFQEIVLAGGRRAEIYRQMADFWKRYGDHFQKVYPQIPRRISGYENLDQLSAAKGMHVARALVGTEATCMIVLRATLKLVPSPPCRALAIIGYRDVFEAADDVPEMLRFKPIGLEGMDHLLVEFMKKKNFKVDELEIMPEGRGWLIAEFGGATPEEAGQKAKDVAAKMTAKGHHCRAVTDKSKQQEVWDVREAGLAVTADIPGMPPTWPGWEDSAVAPDRLGEYLRELESLFHKYGYKPSVYGHFGDGLIHCRVDFDLSSEQGLTNWRHFLEEAADLVVRYGGSLSGEHGDGQARAALLDRMYGSELMAAQREFRAIWDPRQRMNPGKLLDPYPITSNLRVGPGYRPKEMRGLFAYPDDEGSFTKATLRCVGVGECRRRDVKGGVMCPSYLGTDEEMHSTRGRARLLFEMMRGDSIEGGFANKSVEAALDLCLACKGCKHDCPVNVDMATYKAEFRARHYEGRWRPRAAYAMGQIERWAKLASHMPSAANAAMRGPGIGALVKWIGGIAPQRTMPAFAAETFRVWHSKHKQAGGKRVLLWPDTFNNYFRPGTSIAATRVLRQFGFQVDIPPISLCCGRPLYDWGWLDQAKALWRRTLNCLRRDIEEGVPLIGLEPACVSAFRDELPALFPEDPLARKLAQQTRLLSEFLSDQGLAPRGAKNAPGHLLVQFHCHHHAVLEKKLEVDFLSRLPASCEILDTGCCGMAGPFGFEKAKYDVSRRIAEKGFLPRVETFPPNGVVIADGFSCREQIEQLSGRQTLHFAELLSRMMDGSEQ